MFSDSGVAGLLVISELCTTQSYNYGRTVVSVPDVVRLFALRTYKSQYAQNTLPLVKL